MFNWRFFLICMGVLTIPVCTLWLLFWEISAAMRLVEEEPNFLAVASLSIGVGILLALIVTRGPRDHRRQ